MYRGCRPVELKVEYLKYIANGNYLEEDWLTPVAEPLKGFEYVYENLLGDRETACVRVYVDGEFFAIYRKKGHRYVPLQMYHEVDNEKNRVRKQESGE